MLTSNQGVYVMYISSLNAEILRNLVLTALGKLKADSVLKNASLVNVYTSEVIEGVSVAIKSGRVAYVGKNVDHLIGSSTKVFDVKGMYITPGFMDAHIHIESSMLTPLRFSEAVLPHGTTSVFIDPHEIANVLGVKGVEFFIKEALEAPIRIFVNVPSCVPATPEDTTGAKLGPKEVEYLLRNPYTIGLAEMMDFHGVLSLREDVVSKILAAHKLGKIIDGHAPGLSNNLLQAYVSTGIYSDHESVRADEVVEKTRLGMYVMLREGSAWRDLAETLKAVAEKGIDTRMLLLASDDRNPYDIVHEGHMDYIVRKTIELGVDPVKAIQMATLNVAMRFKVEKYLGGVAPGKLADIVVLDDLEKVNVKMVFVDGKLLAKNGRSLWHPPENYKAPSYLYGTINIKRKITSEDFKIKAPIEEGIVKAKVIGVIPEEAITKKLIMDVRVVNGYVISDVERDVLKIAMVERYTGKGRTGLGLVHGFGFKYGALASSIAHDNHNILVVGVDEEDMALAVNKVVEMGGGIVFAAKGEIRAAVKLPVGGIITDKPAEEVAAQLEKLTLETRKAGSKLREPYMTLSILGLIVIPELRITDKGLFDVLDNKFVSLFA